MMKYLVPLFLICLSLGCERVELRPKAGPPAGEEKPQAFSGDYLKDGKGGLFQNVKWYEYEMATHIIWPRFDVFVVRSGVNIHKLQIRSYHHSETNEPGWVKLAIGTSSGAGREIDIDARACGNPFTNPDHAGCLSDPTRNVFTYVNLQSLAQRRMTDEEARVDRDWDIAFRGTDVKLNGGLSGPGEVVGALLERFAFFDENGALAVTKLRDPELKARAVAGFEAADAATARNFYLPDGIDRVMHEREWFSVDPATQKRAARADRWWVLKSPGDEAYAKVRVAQIDESTTGAAAFSTTLTFEAAVQAAGANAFASATTPLTLNFTTDARSTQFCVSFIRQESWTCVKERTDWDLRLLVVNQVKSGALTREWRIFVNEGARGPLSAQEAAAITSGR